MRMKEGRCGQNKNDQSLTSWTAVNISNQELLSFPGSRMKQHTGDYLVVLIILHTYPLIRRHRRTCVKDVNRINAISGTNPDYHSEKILLHMK